MSSNQNLFYLEGNLKRCPKCRKGVVIEDSLRGELVCNNCGLIIKDNEVNTQPEWRAFTKEEREEKSRVGLPCSLAIHDRNLSSNLAVKSSDITGRKLKLSEKKRAQRLLMWDNRSKMQERFHKNLLQAFTELDKIADKLRVSSNVVEMAAYVYRKALKNNLVRGRSINIIITASLYAACRNTNTPRTLKDIAKVSGVHKNDVARGYRLLINKLNLKMPVVNSLKYISKIASKAGVTEKVSRRALKILEKAIELHISTGKDPQGLTASAIYIAAELEGESVTQKVLAEAAGVTEVTIRNRCKGLEKIARSN